MRNPSPRSELPPAPPLPEGQRSLPPPKPNPSSSGIAGRSRGRCRWGQPKHRVILISRWIRRAGIKKQVQLCYTHSGSVNIFPSHQEGRQFTALNPVALHLFETNISENWAGLQFLQAFQWRLTGTAGLQTIAVGDGPVWAKNGRLLFQITPTSANYEKQAEKKIKPKVSTKCSGSAWQLLRGGTLGNRRVRGQQVSSPPAWWLCSWHLGSKGPKFILSTPPWAAAMVVPPECQGFLTCSEYPMAQWVKYQLSPDLEKKDFFFCYELLVKFPLEHQWW